MGRRRRSVSEHDLRERLARTVRRLRNELELTVREAAARVRMHPRQWQKVEGGETNATLSTLALLGQALDVDPVVLLEEPPPAAAAAPKPRR